MSEQPEDTWTDTDRVMFVDQARKAMKAADARSARLIELRDIIEKVVDRSACPVPTHDPLVTELTAAVMGQAELVADEREQQVRAELEAADLKRAITTAFERFPGATLMINPAGNLCVIHSDIHLAWIDMSGDRGLVLVEPWIDTQAEAKAGE